MINNKNGEEGPRSGTKQNRSAATLVIALVLVFSLYPAAIRTTTRSVSMASSHAGNANQLLTLSYTSWNASSDPPPNIANVSTRDEILGFINSNPGVYLRDVSEEMGLALGDVEYHLWILVRDGEIVDRRDGRYRRFFGSGSYSEMEQKVISALRKETTGRIVAKLADGQSVSHVQLAAMLGITSQAVTWQMGRLRSTGFVEVVRGSDGKSYRLIDGALRFVQSYLRTGRTAVHQSTEVPIQEETATRRSMESFL